jgi:hypothetical protein
MYTHPDRIGQLVDEHHRELLADARQRQLRRHSRPAPGTPGTTITRRLAAVIARLGVAAARVPESVRPARPRPLGDTPGPR